MFFIGATQNGCVLMPTNITPEQQTATATATYLTYPAYSPAPVPAALPSATSYLNTYNHLNTTNMIIPNQQIINTFDYHQYDNNNNNNNNNSNNKQQQNNNNNTNYYPNMVKSKRSGYVSKSRNNVIVKRTTVDNQINLAKSCPNCSRYWRNCKCSNIKNRPDPKPYCKFVPPRMQRKQTIVSAQQQHEN